MRMRGIEPRSPHWKCGIITIIRHTLFYNITTLHMPPA